MKQKYVFLRDVDRVNVKSVIFHVWLPDSERGRQQRQFLTQYAAEHDAWFELWGEHVDFRIDYYQERVFWGAPVGVTHFRIVDISSSQLIAAIKSNILQSIEDNAKMPRLYFYLMSHCYCAANLLPKIVREKAILQTSSRKNLSMRRGSEVTDAVVGMVLVAILFVVQMILDAIERGCLS